MRPPISALVEVDVCINIQRNCQSVNISVCIHYKSSNCTENFIGQLFSVLRHEISVFNTIHLKLLKNLGLALAPESSYKSSSAMSTNKLVVAQQQSKKLRINNTFLSHGILCRIDRRSFIIQYVTVCLCFLQRSRRFYSSVSMSLKNRSYSSFDPSQMDMYYRLYTCSKKY